MSTGTNSLNPSPSVSGQYTRSPTPSSGEENEKVQGLFWQRQTSSEPDEEALEQGVREIRSPSRDFYAEFQNQKQSSPTDDTDSMGDSRENGPSRFYLFRAISDDTDSERSSKVHIRVKLKNVHRGETPNSDCRESPDMDLNVREVDLRRSPNEGVSSGTSSPSDESCTVS